MTRQTPLVARYRHVADGIAALFHPHVEVVIHDLATETVAYIAANVSKRSIGDESALQEIAFDPTENVIGPYEKTNWDGARIRSISIVVRDDDGRAYGVLCINANFSVFDRAKAALSLLLESPVDLSQPEKLFRDDWQERINTFLQDWLNERGLVLTSLSRQLKRELIEALYAAGAFKGRSAAPYVANILGVARATIFNHLKNLRENDED